jgi:hypothetical protein
LLMRHQVVLVQHGEKTSVLCSVYYAAVIVMAKMWTLSA